MTATLFNFKGKRRDFLGNLHARMESYSSHADVKGHTLRSYIRDSGINLTNLAKGIEVDDATMKDITRGQYKRLTPYQRERIKRFILAHLTFEYMMAS